MFSKIKTIFLVALCASVSLIQSMCSTQCDICAHTTLIPRSMSQFSVLELAQHNYYLQHQCDDEGDYSRFQVQYTAPYYFKSTNRKAVARYFLPQCKESVTIAQNNTSDISSPWLELLTVPPAAPYLSTLAIRPTRTVIGGAIKLFIDFSHGYEDCPWYYNCWLSVFVPVQQARHKLHITEDVINGPSVTPGIPNALIALNNPSWLYGKLPVNGVDKVGVDDVAIKWGFHTYNNCNKNIDLYALMFAPTGHGTNARTLFEPRVGSNHFGLGGGINTDCILENDTFTLDCMMDIRYAYFFKNTERRMVDLYNGDWSRYLLVTSPTATLQPLPGINFFSPEVMVHPRGFFEFWGALNLTYCDWHFEVGYDFWYRDREKVTLPDLDLGVGILDIAFNPVTSCPVSASCARICAAVANQTDSPVSNPTFVTVKNSNEVIRLAHLGKNNGLLCASTALCSFLNLDSAANPKALSSTVYGAISRDFSFCCHPAMVGVGGSYEFAHRRSALSQYGVWFKANIGF